ncbi:hypothetical protein FB451DRAFT_1265503 [Mycena latifolia]|nr:hypothetical protein FB451DRAFT_1265503 [Mycena latifolia]
MSGFPNITCAARCLAACTSSRRAPLPRLVRVGGCALLHTFGRLRAILCPVSTYTASSSRAAPLSASPSPSCSPTSARRAPSKISGSTSASSARCGGRSRGSSARSSSARRRSSSSAAWRPPAELVRFMRLQKLTSACRARSSTSSFCWRCNTSSSSF